VYCKGWSIEIPLGKKKSGNWEYFTQAALRLARVRGHDAIGTGTRRRAATDKDGRGRDARFDPWGARRQKLPRSPLHFPSPNSPRRCTNSRKLKYPPETTASSSFGRSIFVTCRDIWSSFRHQISKRIPTRSIGFHAAARGALSYKRRRVVRLVPASIFVFPLRKPPRRGS
jgi:hypothetical protein